MTGRGGGGPRSDLKFTTPSECKMFSGGLRSPSRITHQLGKYDLEPKSVFPDATGSHPMYGEVSGKCQIRKNEIRIKFNLKLPEDNLPTTPLQDTYKNLIYRKIL